MASRHAAVRRQVVRVPHLLGDPAVPELQLLQLLDVVGRRDSQPIELDEITTVTRPIESVSENSFCVVAPIYNFRKL